MSTVTVQGWANGAWVTIETASDLSARLVVPLDGANQLRVITSGTVGDLTSIVHMTAYEVAK